MVAPFRDEGEGRFAVEGHRTDVAGSMRLGFIRVRLLGGQAGDLAERWPSPEPSTEWRSVDSAG
jgi:hypothetical protein